MKLLTWLSPPTKHEQHIRVFQPRCGKDGMGQEETKELSFTFRVLKKGVATSFVGGQLKVCSNVLGYNKIPS